MYWTALIIIAFIYVALHPVYGWEDSNMMSELTAAKTNVFKQFTLNWFISICAEKLKKLSIQRENVHNNMMNEHEHLFWAPPPPSFSFFFCSKKIFKGIFMAV